MKEQVSFNFVLWQLLHRTFRAADKVRERELEQWGLTAQKSAVLRVVLRLGREATPKEISRQLVLEKNTISEQLKRMEREGLVKKVKDPDRKNVVRIEVTDRGYEFHLKTRTQSSIEKIMSALTDEEKRELWSTLSKIREKANQELGIYITNLYPPSDYSTLFSESFQPLLESEQMPGKRRH